MPCPRCRGLMVHDQFADWHHDGGYYGFIGWRCLCCGNILDPVIMKNQRTAGKVMAAPLSSLYGGGCRGLLA